MKRALGAAAVALAIGCAGRTPPQGLEAPGLATPAAAANGNRTVWDGVYTEEQSRRGEAVYASACVLCHKPALTGAGIVPPLAGEEFLGRWNRKTAGDLFEQMRTSMPPVIAGAAAAPAASSPSGTSAPSGAPTASGSFAATAGAAPAPSGGGAPALKLSSQEYADVLAYILSRNQFPAGGEELAADFAALSVIRMAPVE